LIEPVRGTGLQVAEGAPQRCQEARAEFVRGRLRSAIDEVRRTELDSAQIESILHEEWARGSDTNGASGDGRDTR
jgi:GntR family transcriptional regulator